MAPTAYEPYCFNVVVIFAAKPVDQAAALDNIAANCAVGTSLTNGETLPKRFKPHSSKAVAFDARSHVGAGLRKADATKISPPSASSRSKFLRPLASSAHAPAYGAHRFPPCLGTIIATTKEE
ncbi:hypothetical protein [Sinorhizobium medicae]|uniref:hypothetical protein n=1 Tax=Sinorhizobium medicae TaxID=110321 RepID=UPI00037F3E04|nr:hypothetical protein [Sinorhizobium medicae]